MSFSIFYKRNIIADALFVSLTICVSVLGPPTFHPLDLGPPDLPWPGGATDADLCEGPALPAEAQGPVVAGGPGTALAAAILHLRGPD